MVVSASYSDVAPTDGALIRGRTLIGTGSTPVTTALFELQSTSQVFLPMRMTDAQMLAIVSPAVGSLVENSDFANVLFYYNGSTWERYVTQTLLDLKANIASPTFTGTVTFPTPFTLGAVSVLPTGTELNYVDGVTSGIQAQLDTKAPLASPTFTGNLTTPTIKITSGVPGAGKVLTSDADGDATWETPAGGGVTEVTGTSPISVATGTTTPVVSISDAAADGATKGAASFDPDDFNESSGNVSLDYANGTMAGTENNGFLSSTDWNTFNNKMPDPTDPTVAPYFVDEFWGQGNETGEIGSANWVFANGSIQNNNGASQQHHPGVVTRRSGTTGGQVATFSLVATANLNQMRFDELNEATFIIKLNGVDNDFDMKIGLFSDASTATPTHGLYFERLAADASWFGVSINASTQTRTAALVAESTNWVRFKLRRISATLVGFSVDGGTEVTISASNIPDAADLIALCLSITPTTTTARDFYIDFVSMKLNPLTR